MTNAEGMQFIISDSRRLNVALNIILYFQEIYDKEEHIDMLLNIINFYLNSVDSTRYYISNLIFRSLFNLLINHNRNLQGLEILLLAI
jgi:hypothetical protein